MARGEQIDKISKQYVLLSRKEIKFEKKQHKRFLRRQAKKIYNPNPQSNRYRGWIG